jgi:hypothetical protein
MVWRKWCWVKKQARLRSLAFEKLGDWLVLAAGTNPCAPSKARFHGSLLSSRARLPFWLAVTHVFSAAAANLSATRGEKITRIHRQNPFLKSIEPFWRTPRHQTVQ